MPTSTKIETMTESDRSKWPSLYGWYVVKDERGVVVAFTPSLGKAHAFARAIEPIYSTTKGEPNVRHGDT